MQFIPRSARCEVHFTGTNWPGHFGNGGIFLACLLLLIHGKSRLTHRLRLGKSVFPPHCFPSTCRQRRPPSLFLQTDYPPQPAGSQGSSATHRGPIRAELAGRKTMAGQMASWPRRAIIYRNSGAVRLKEREGEVAWRPLPLIRLLPASSPIMRTGRTSAVYFLCSRLFCASLAVSKTALLTAPTRRQAIIQFSREV